MAVHQIRCAPAGRSRANSGSGETAAQRNLKPKIRDQQFGANSAARAATLGGWRLARTERSALAHLADADRRGRIGQERLGMGGGAADLQPPLGGDLTRTLRG